MKGKPNRTAAFATLLLVFAGCGKHSPEGDLDAAAPGVLGSSSQTSLEDAAVPAPARKKRAPPVREGGALVRAARGDALYLADEDHGVLRRIPLPIGEGATEVPLPGRPAEVLALDGRVLVTIRDPGLLLVLKEAEDGALSEESRIAVPPDAWGIAVTADEQMALVTSAWTHAVTAVDLTTGVVRFSLDIGREPRGVVITKDGSRAYVTHLVGERVTRIDGLSGTPRASTFEGKPVDPDRPSPKTPGKAPRGAGLGYAAVLSPDGSRLFLPHHRVLGFGPSQWFGEPTVDVIATKDDASLLPPHVPGPYWAPNPDNGVGVLGDGPTAFVAPRAAVYRERTRTLLVASEATDALFELDALSLLPAEVPIGKYQLGRHYEFQVTAAKEGGAPTGIALSADENTAYVFCRSTYDIVTVPLGDGISRAPIPLGITYTRVAKDPLSEDEAMGRRLYYTAMDPDLSDGVSCATCHPDGRDDGFVWGETGEGNFLSFPRFGGNEIEVNPRQTPMLAGRVGAEGPYGWLAESPNLRSRIIASFSLHRWNVESTWRLRSNEVTVEPMPPGEPQRKHRGEYLAQYLRKGLVPPPRAAASAPEVVQRGKTIFMDPAVGCAGCHDPAREYTNRVAVPLAPARRHPRATEPANTPIRTPSLLFVGGTAPYLHDGSVDTLEDLVEENGDRMGKTGQLSKADKDALVAFLKTL